MAAAHGCGRRRGCTRRDGRGRAASGRLAKRLGELGRSLETFAGHERQGAGQRGFQLRRRVRDEGPERWRRRGEPLASDGGGCGARERQAAGCGFVQGQPERIHIGTGVGIGALDDFGREVSDGAQDVARLVGRHGPGDGFGDAEIDGLRNALFGDQDVLRFYVAMDDALFVGVLERRGDLGAITNDLGFCQAAPGFDELTQRLAMHVLHDEVVPAFVDADIVDADDVRMLEAGHEPRFAFEGGDELVVFALDQAFAQEFNRDPAAEALVLSEPHLGHTAGTEQAFEAISFTYDISDVQTAMAFQVGGGIRSGERNREMLLLVASVAFLAVAWRALEAAAVPLPPASARILTQFALVALFGHLGLRIVAPRASALPFAVAMMLTAIGVAFVARLEPDLAQDQVNWVTIGVVLMVIGAAFARRYPVLRNYKYTAALVALALLVVTGVFGETRYGARLWISVAGQTIQTTELIKVLLVVFLAGYFADEASVLATRKVRFGGRTYSTLPYLIPLVLTLLLAMASLALLRDLGTIALLLLLSVTGLYVATGRAVFVLGGVALLALTGVFGYLAFDHAQTRIDVWLDPWEDPDNTGYQTLQSIYAIQAGGVTGEGLGLGSPDVIPAVTTDYIFAAIGEELGLAGAIGVVMLYVLLLFAGLRVALELQDAHGRLLAACIALLIAIQAAVIIAGNLRLIPTTGITLPFVSYGGSSLVVNFLLVGVLLGVSDAARRRV